MRIFDETKTAELETYDPQEGFLKADTLVIHHEAAPEKLLKSAKEQAQELTAAGREVEEEDGAYFLVLKTYPSGGRDVERLQDLKEPGREACDEEERIAVFVPFTKAQKAEREIALLKQKLSESDYKALKYSEGYLTEEEYAPIKAERQSWRDRINALEVTME